MHTCSFFGVEGDGERAGEGERPRFGVDDPSFFRPESDAPGDPACEYSHLFPCLQPFFVP